MNPRSRIQATANLSTVLQKINAFVKEVGIGLTYSATQIADGDVRQILGMVWILISKFVIPESEENLSAKRSLLRWVQRVTEPYDNVDVKNFHKSWKDGLAFNALLDQYDSSIMDYSKLQAKNSAANLKNAFDKAEEIGISALLDVEDIEDVARPDEKSVMTYVSTMYQYFHAHANKKLEQDVKNFIIDVGKLIEWINKSTQEYQIPESWPEDTGECKKIEEDLGKFNTTKAQFANYKCNLYVRLAGIQRIQRNERLKVFVPDDDKNLNVVHKGWIGLNDTLIAYGNSLRDQMDKLEREQRQREEEAIKAKEDDERRKREEFKRKVDAEIKKRETEEKDDLNKERDFFDKEAQRTFDRNQVMREVLSARDEEAIERNEQQKRKRIDFENDRKNKEIESLEKEKERKRERDMVKDELERGRTEEIFERNEQQKQKRETFELDEEKQEQDFYDKENQRVRDKLAIVDEIEGRRTDENIERNEDQKSKRQNLEDKIQNLENEFYDKEDARVLEKNRIVNDILTRRDDEVFERNEQQKKKRENFEVKDQNKEREFYDFENERSLEKGGVIRDLERTRRTEHSERKEQEEEKREALKQRKKKTMREVADKWLQKKIDADKAEAEEKKKAQEEKRKDEEEERNKKAEEARQKKDDERKKRDDELQEKMENDKKLADEERQKRAEERRLKDEEREKKEAEENQKREDERKAREEENQKKREEALQKAEDEKNKREEERKKNDEERIAKEEEEKQKLEADKTEREEALRKKKEDDLLAAEEDAKKRAEEAKARDEEMNKKIEDDKVKRVEKKREEDEEAAKREEDAAEERRRLRKEREDAIAKKEDDERAARKAARDKAFQEKKDKEAMERKLLDVYDVEAGDYLKWVVQTQDVLSEVKVVQEDEEDLSTDEETRKKKRDAVDEAKGKIKSVMVKWDELCKLNISEWASVPKDEVVYATEAMSFALVGEESDNLGKIRQFKMEL